MKKKLFTTLMMVCLFVATGTLQAQLLLEEYFDYDANRPLIMDAVASSDNYDGVTGWSTQNNSKSGINCFDIVEGPLTYDGYIGSGIGNSVRYNGDDGQGPFKLFSENVNNDSTVYISFLVKFSGDEKVTGGDYFLGIKMEPSATSTNWGGRIYAAVDPAYEGEEVSLGINKLSGGTTTWVNAATGPFLPANTTHLLVIKYYVGILNGSTAAEEEGKYDDIMSLYINPDPKAGEPETPDLIHQDASQKDIYRYASSGIVMGGARGIYFRPSVKGNAPVYQIDGIRVGLTWEDVLPVSNSLKNVSAKNFSYRVDNKIIEVSASEFDYSSYVLTNLAGQAVLSGSLQSDSGKIDASKLNTGVYILNLKGNQQASAKIIIR